MKQVVELSDIERQIEHLTNSAYRDYKRGDWDLRDKKIDALFIIFDLLENLLCESETWRSDMSRLNAWKDSMIVDVKENK